MFQQIIGIWPSHKQLLLCSCDDVYLNKYFPRFYQTFTKHWQLPIHVHVIDPIKKSLAKLEALKLKNDRFSYTYCETRNYDWLQQVQKFKQRNAVNGHTDAVIKQWLYESYCQCQRFVVMGEHIQNDQSVIVADVDAYAQHKPTEQQRAYLLENTGFTHYKDRLMATFCHFHSKDITKTKQLAKNILNNTFEIGLDQTAIKKIFQNADTVDLKNGEWIRHWDIKTAADQRAHAKCLIYHAKGLRGKQKPVEITWIDIK